MPLQLEAAGTSVGNFTEQKYYYARFRKEITVFWAVTPCSHVHKHRRQSTAFITFPEKWMNRVYPKGLIHSMKEKSSVEY